VRQYVGVPFDQAPCWDLCRRVYLEQFDIALPEIGGPAPPIVAMDKPEEGCLVRVRRVAPLSEHWGIYTSGHVLHAQRPSSAMIPLRRFLQSHPHTEFFKVLPA
jgi:hypothetical protein